MNRTINNLNHRATEAQRNKQIKSVKSFLKSLCLSASAAFSMLLLAGRANAIECKIMEPEALKKAIKNKSAYNMVMIDVATRFDSAGRRKFDLRTDRRRIPWTIWASVEEIEKELVGRVEELVDKDVVLVGDNTESAKNACNYMIKKDYGIRNIYILKGGMEKWDGPVLEDFTKIECKMIISRDLINIIKSDRKVEIIDQRQAEEYHEGHIPGARFEDRRGGSMMRPSMRFRLQKQERRKKWEQENTTVVYVYPNEFQALRDCRYTKYFSWGYKDIYVLRGGMKAWEGEIERDYLEILKNKAKKYIK
jgi:3-mercaptopyruvate sulfurtransferase SseA